MKKTWLSCWIMGMSFPLIGMTQPIADLEIKLTAKPGTELIPVSTDLDAISFIPDSSLLLLDITTQPVPVPFQVYPGNTRKLVWQIQPKPGITQYRFRLQKGKATAFPPLQTENTDGTLTILSDNHSLLRYVFKTVYPPAGIDSSYGRSGFIHPLWTPSGQELTRIQPPDHYHHYGIWNPWTHVLIEKDTVDFWNIGDKKGTVRFAGFPSRSKGIVFAEYQALMEHVVWPKTPKEKVVLNELQTVRVYKPGTPADYYIADVEIQMSCTTDIPFHILAYRYAGFGWRATAFWKKDNSEMLTSEGKDRPSTDGTRAKWCIVQGQLPEGSGGVVMMSYPANYNHPEPLRIWDQNANGGRGDVFANFAPTKNTDWVLEPGNKYVLRYRLLVFDGKKNAAQAETAWQYFAHPPQVNIIKRY